MAGKRVRRQQNNVDQQHQRAHTHPEFPVKIEREKDVFPQEKQKQHRQIKKISVYVLQNERKSRFALIVSFPFGDRASRRILKKRPIVCLPVIVAGGPKAQRPSQNKHRR